MNRHCATCFLFSAAAALVSCHQGAPAAGQGQDTSPAAVDPMEIHLSTEDLARVKTGKVVWAEVGASFTVAARVEVDEHRITRVGSPVMGRIASLAVQEGEPVRRGQTLALINSTGLSGAQLDFLKALSQRLLAQRAVERAGVLLKADVIGSAELQRREAELAQASAELAAARDQLALLGMAAEAIEELQRTRAMNSVSRVEASMDGTVMDRRATMGQVVQPADTIFEIADLSNVWLVADVPEQNAGTLSAGQLVEAEITALPGLKIQGRLDFVSATVNPETRTVTVRMNLPNPQRRFKPAMLATMVLKEYTERQRVVPIAAVVREENTEYVFVETLPGKFTLRPVQLGAELAGKRVLVDGIREEERIVVDGAFHLNNERRRRSVRGGEGA